MHRHGPGWRGRSAAAYRITATWVLLAACCGPWHAARAANEQTIALVMKALTNPFFTKMQEGAKQYAQWHRIALEVFGVERETDVERQISIVENLISRGYGAVVIAPADSKELVPVCRRAMDAGMIVINIDNPLHRETLARSGISIPFVGPDNRAAAAEIGDYIKRRLQGRGRVLVVEGIRGVENAEHRKLGFSKAVTRNSDIQIVASESANWHTDEAFSLATELLQRHHSVDAVFCANDKMALGVLQALEIQGLDGDVLLAGYDNIEAVRDEMRQARIHATVEQHPELMGEYGVKLAVRALQKKPIPDFIPTPVDLITHETFAKQVAMSISSTNNPFFTTLARQAMETGRLHGFELRIYDANNSDAQQLSDVTSILEAGVEALIINPTNIDTVGAGIELANELDIPVITVDRKAAEGEVVCHIESDNRQGGSLAAAVLARHLSGQGRVVELEGIPGTSAAQERGMGFNEALKEFPEITVVAREVANFDRQHAAAIMRDLLDRGVSFDGVFAHNDNMILGALDALQSAGEKDLPVLVGFDGIQEAVQAVREGQLAATIAQRPLDMAALSIENIARLCRGVRPDPRILVELDLLERDGETTQR